MSDKEQEVLAAYGNLIDNVVDTSDDPEARTVDGSLGEVVSAEEYLKNPEKFGQAEEASRQKTDPLGLGKLPEPATTVEAIERGPESAAAEEVRYIRQAFQVKASRVRSAVREPIKSCVKEMLSPEELAKVQFVDSFESNIEGQNRTSLGSLFGSLRSE